MNICKKATRGTALFLAFLMILSTTALAVNSRASDTFIRYSASLSLKDDGDLEIYFNVATSRHMDIIGASTINIQRYNGTRWVTEETLTVNDCPEIQTSNASRHSASITYTPDYTGATYQAVVTVYAKDSSGSSTSQTTTAQVRT